MEAASQRLGNAVKNKRRNTDAQIKHAHGDNLGVLNINPHNGSGTDCRQKHAEYGDQSNKTKHERDRFLYVGKILPSIILGGKDSGSRSHAHAQKLKQVDKIVSQGRSG